MLKLALNETITQIFLTAFFFYLGDDQPAVSRVEWLRSATGAFLGLLLVVFAAKFLGELSAIDEWLMASLEASATIVFALPQSPMAQPWVVIVGNTLSALVSITTFHYYDQSLLAIPVAASLSILGMFMLRCPHPPAAAVALIAVLSSIGSYWYAFFPVMADSVLFILIGACSLQQPYWQALSQQAPINLNPT